jgi:hypothetical protein
VERRKTGMLGARVGHFHQKNKNASLDAPGNSIGGRAARRLEIPSTVNVESGIGMAASLHERRVSRRHEPNTMEAGSVKRTAMKQLKQMMTSQRYATENGGATATVQTATGLVVLLKSNQNPNGWMRTIVTSPDGRTHRKTLSAGRSV